MRHSYSQISGSYIYSVSDSSNIGIVKDVCIDETNGKIKALLVPGFSIFTSRKLIVLPQDIINWTDSIFVSDRSALTEPIDVIRLQNIYAEHFSLIGLSVKTECEAIIGRVNDYKICDVEMNLFSISVRTPFPDLSILEIRKRYIIFIGRDGIIVEDSVVKQKEIKKVDEKSVYIPEPTYCADKSLK